LDKLTLNPNFELIINTLCIEIKLSTTDGSPVVYTQDLNGTVNFISCKSAIIAAGTFQSTKLFLSSKDLVSLDQSGAAGHYLMEHLEGYVGTLTVAKKNEQLLKRLVLDSQRLLAGQDFGVSVTFSERLRSEKKFLNVGVEITPKEIRYFFDPQKYRSYPSIRKKIFFCFYLMERLVKGVAFRIIALSKVCVNGSVDFSLWIKGEELPFFNSLLRVDTDDASKLVYEHLISEKTSLEIRRALREFKNVIENEGFGTVAYNRHVLDDSETIQLRPNWHPMGTLRMGEPLNGIVNHNLLIHGTSGVFVLSPAVFPTGSNQNPVFTTLALALRLAEHLSINAGKVCS
jgi:choline dehydrogenase-like flavoprotein